MQAVDKLSHELRSAMLGSDLVRAEELTTRYAAALESTWFSLTEAERTVSELPSQARELLAWCREVTIMHRALAAEHLVALDRANRYRNHMAQGERSVEVRA